MTDILCRWLNNDLNISKCVDQVSFGHDFASGYLIGEVLYKYQLQDDFDQFSATSTSESKLQNFTRLEPVLHLLSIPFDTKVARDIMTEKHGTATRLMYQLFIALTNKKKANLTGVAMETMRPAAPAKLNAMESVIYKERLKHITPRQTDLNLDALMEQFHDKQIQMEKVAFKKRFEEQERQRTIIQQQRQVLLEKSRQMRNKQNEVIAKINAATMNIPKSVSNKTIKALHMKRESRKIHEAEEIFTAINEFEEQMKRTVPPSKLLSEDEICEPPTHTMSVTGDAEAEDMYMASEMLIQPATNDEYIGKIRKRLQEDENARHEREKRRRKVLVDQMNAHQALEEARREEMLVNRLMRQSQQERRIAVQLMHTRHEKEVLRKNRILREKQYEERRLRDFEEALDREGELARLANEQYLEQTKKDKELHDQIMGQRAKERYTKHYDMCMATIQQVVDFSCKVAEYRELTDRQVPVKMFRDWVSIFVKGQPMYDVIAEQVTEITPEQVLQEERQQLLDEGDFMEYKNMIGEWSPPEMCDFRGPPKDNAVVGHVVQRLFNMVHPPSPPPPPPQFPAFPVKACILGKLFSGKSTCAERLIKEHRLTVLNVEVLVEEAIEAHKIGEVHSVPIETYMQTSSETVIAASEATPSSALEDPQMFSPDLKTPEPDSSKIITDDSTLGAPTDIPGAPFSPSADEGLSGDISSSLTTNLASGSIESQIEYRQEATARAKLGAKALKCLKRGKPVDDQIVVTILVNVIGELPEGTGWILDGYPNNYMQAKLLEKALTGFEPDADRGGTTRQTKSKKSALVPDPRPPPPLPEPTSGIDVVILMDVPNDLCLRRAAGRYHTIQGTDSYHQEFKPPPEGSTTGVGTEEQVIPTQDPGHDQEQMQHRITSFLDSWPKLEKWFTKFGMLKVMDASQEADTVYLEIEKVLEDIVNKGKEEEISVTAKEEPPAPEVPAEPAMTGIETAPGAPQEEPQPPQSPPGGPGDKQPSSKPGSRAGSAISADSRSRSKSPKKGDKSKSPARGSSKKQLTDDTGKKSQQGSRDSSGKSGKSKRSSGKKQKTPEPDVEPEPEPEVPTGPPAPQPGSEEWQFVDLDITMVFASVLSTHWEVIETTYVKNSKCVFRQIRDERENIIKYFFQIRKDFLAYLRRPDHKQEFVAQCQSDFNEVSDDMRGDDETQSELHERVDDLREQLWTICDKRKDQAENERSVIITDGWLEDRLGIVSNHYITLMQTEVDRLQDTVRLMKDYYHAMEGNYPDELNKQYARLPLIELPTDLPAEAIEAVGIIASPEVLAPVSPAPVSPAAEDRPITPAKSPTKDRPRSETRSKSRTPSGKRSRNKDKKEEKLQETPSVPDIVSDGQRKRIPLVPRRPVSPDPDGKAGKDKGKKPVKKDDLSAESPQIPPDLDEKLITDAHQNSLGALSTIMSAEQAAREAELEAEKQRELEKQKEAERNQADKQKKAPAGKGKKGGGKSRSPSPKKKGGKSDAESTPATTPTFTEEESDEVKEKKLNSEKMKEEYYFAIKDEDLATKARLELIRVCAVAVLQLLKDQANNVYKDMNDWLGARFLKEMESIDQLSEVMRNGIENKECLKNELVLQQEEFLIEDEHRVFFSPSPPPPATPTEQPTAEYFTVKQMTSLLAQFQKTAPSGVISTRAFNDILENMISVAHGLEVLPDAWMNVTVSQIQDLCTNMCCNADYLDWRRFMHMLLIPIPIPTQSQLLDTLSSFRELDQRSTGYITREQFSYAALWFTPEPPSPDTYDRVGKLKQLLYDMFFDFKRQPQGLDYVSMLLYFSTAPLAKEGLLRGLSVASGTHMPRLSHLSHTHNADNFAESVLDIMKSQDQLLVEDIPESANEASVPLSALYKVLHHGVGSHGDSHRFPESDDSEDMTSYERLLLVYRELGGDEYVPVLYRVLVEHPLIQDVMAGCLQFKALDIRSMLSQYTDNTDTHSTKTID